MITKKQIQEIYSSNKRGLITDELVDTINLAISTGKEEAIELVQENFITYQHILANAKYSIEQYTNAIKFISCKMMDMTNIDAYMFTYPERYEKYRFKAIDVDGLTDEEFRASIGSYVSAVARGKLVTTILSQVQVPTKLLNMGLLQEAINVEASLMRSARSEIVREKAANTLIQYLGQEEDNKIQIDAGYKKDDIIEQYEIAMKTMVEEQLVQINNGACVKAIANAPIVEAEVVE